jgi:hypothetical protein
VVHHRSMATSAMLGNANRGFLFERNAFLTAYKNYEDGLLEKMLPAILLTLSHRTQTLLVQNNPGGEQLTFDPYAGLIANTARREDPDSGDASGESPQAANVLSAPPSPNLWQKWKGYGPRDFMRRGVRKGLRMALPSWAFEERLPWETRLTDDRTVAQLRVLTQILGNLDGATERRRVVQSRRQREDREIFERFPLYVVPTYPGDERLFASAAFRSWLGDEVPVVYAELDEIMKT